MQYFSDAWNVIKDDLVAWVLFGFVWSLTLGVGIGLFLMPNALRTIRRAVNEGTKPDINGLFNFDDIAPDAIVMATQLVLGIVGMLCCCVGYWVVSVLFFWLPHLAADGHTDPATVLKTSMAHTKSNIGSVVVFMLVAAAINFVGAMCCYFGSLLTTPLTLVAFHLFYEAEKEAIAAAGQGIQ